MNKIKLSALENIEDRSPAPFQINGLDLVAIRYDDKISVLYGRCLHRGALLGDGHIEGDNLICGVHGWDYRFDNGISEYKKCHNTDVNEGVFHHPKYSQKHKDYREKWPST